ncbi:MAG: D-aminoacyl-tRNA deacylase [Armatimonadota bacterium]|nr:D-aminoacyl-tRNA deacylase [Armatimonadota bacterium]MDR7451237.1 D-aminoacyl-tRNA deacylase [Armatimonadota bacterium]MDR7466860.1 D-aminoacyl-tRNA deacylase [Armatimonadota bacterium]MDR7492667.1 D-aminoacyl-tRNA deacylase [Armatimonadota bacterium]MDR7499971.1 D-aminoacyl-tRNA deacylase [Armatimonadota bacterium]
MRAVVQRVSRARVRVGEEVVGEIGRGYAVLLGVHVDDTEAQAAALAEKVAHLRVFDDEAGKLNRSILDVGGAVLSVSQFTLYGNTEKGRRPSFIAAAPPERAEALYHVFNERLRALGVPVATGRFRAVMSVEIHNEGPVTLMLEEPPPPRPR